MTTHELAKKLLENEDMELQIYDGEFISEDPIRTVEIHDRVQVVYRYLVPGRNYKEFPRFETQLWSPDDYDRCKDDPAYQFQDIKYVKITLIDA